MPIALDGNAGGVPAQGKQDIVYVRVYIDTWYGPSRSQEHYDMGSIITEHVEVSRLNDYDSL
ncbi:hypothetical protein CFR73_07345 [Novacetimonas maltaceti]|uniref:Uncharacterized protein n=1 Tax=Novacetimonas maltaceti TaxID=1203393 RepID=A0A2S3W0E9_9PROT|nr:hypothetical protein KMAL_20510 [Novacetimonas maltaceti]PYD60463.1 hypothetical protein CFR73_07345 [Novacetimonas maltaceti]